MSDRYQWVPITRGEALTAGAVLVGKTKNDGDVYIGRNKSGETGKITMSKDGLMYNIWCHDGGSSSSGEQLVVTKGCQITWRSTKKGQPISEITDACQCSATKNDGPIYVCRDSGNYVGKLNLSGDKVNNFWYQGAWSASKSGDILCVGAVGGVGTCPAGPGQSGYTPVQPPLPPPSEAPPGDDEISSGDHVFLLAHTGKHIDVEGEAVRARWHDQGWFQNLKIENQDGTAIKSGDTVFFTAHTGKVLDCEKDVVQARYTDKLDWQKFVISTAAGGIIKAGEKIFLKSANTGKDVDVEGPQSNVQARYEDHGAWQTLTIQKGGSSESSAGHAEDKGPAIQCLFPHTLQVVGDRLKIVVTPPNPHEVSLVAVHYQVNGGQSMNFDINHESSGHTYVHTTPSDPGYPACKSGDKVSYWLCVKVNGLLVNEPEDAMSAQGRMSWTAP